MADDLEEIMPYSTSRYEVAVDDGSGHPLIWVQLPEDEIPELLERYGPNVETIIVPTQVQNRAGQLVDGILHIRKACSDAPDG